MVLADNSLSPKREAPPGVEMAGLSLAAVRMALYTRVIRSFAA
jgi:hypothetical protein